MPAKILDGNAIAAQIRGEVRGEVRRLEERGIRPGLAAVLVGNDPASEVYVRNKVRACEEAGIYSEKITPPESSTTQEVLSLIKDLNGRDNIDGILVQLPLPKQVDAQAVLLAVNPEKDVDGLHPLNVGRLQTRRPAMAPCTPAGVIEILKRSGINMRGAHAVILGRSDLVGKPVAMLLLHHDATITVCHSQTRGLEHYTQEADILVCAIGRAGMITPAMVKPGATVIDVGINKVSAQQEFECFFRGDEKRERAFQKNGYVLMGDCDPQVASVAENFTPVPGGVGPLTIAMLLSNTLKAARLRRGLSEDGC